MSIRLDKDGRLFRDDRLYFKLLLPDGSIEEKKTHTEEEAKIQFGFLMDAFKYGAPPHGGVAFGLDRWVAMFHGSESIRDVIAFPKNNAGRDIMIDAPAKVENSLLDDLGLKLKENNS